MTSGTFKNPRSHSSSSLWIGSVPHITRWLDTGDRAHLHGIKAVGCTLTPFEGAAYYSDKGEEIRTAYNTWIRTGGAFDAVVDFDKAVQDPANPKQIKAEFNIMDHLHPNDAGYKAMADSINLSIFTGQKK